MRFDSFKVRRPSRGFGWVDRRVVTEGHLSRMNQAEAAVYLVLCVVADRHGISYYRPESLGGLLKQPIERVQKALVSLGEQDFLALEGRFVQVVDLDDRDLPRESPGESPGPVTLPESDDERPPDRVAGTILEAMPPKLREDLLEKARAQLRSLSGNQPPTSSVVQALAVSLWKESTS